MVGTEARGERGARARGRGGGGRLARREEEPGDGPTRDEERGARVEQHRAGAGVLGVGLGLARPAGVGLAAVGRVEEPVVRAPAQGRDDPTHQGEGASAPEADRHRVADRGPAGTRVGRHDGRVRPPVGLDGRVDARTEGHRDAELVGVTRHGHVERDGVAPDLRIKSGVGPHREERLAREGERLDRLGRRGHGGSRAAVALSLELRALGAGGSGSEARHDGAPVALGRSAGRREVHDELVGSLGGRIRHVGNPLPLEGRSEAARVEVGHGGQDRPLVLQPRRAREGRQRPVGRREGAARGGDPTSVRQSRRRGLRGSGRLPEGGGRRTEHSEEHENKQTTGLHDGG